MKPTKIAIAVNVNVKIVTAAIANYFNHRFIVYMYKQLTTTISKT